MTPRLVCFEGSAVVVALLGILLAEPSAYGSTTVLGLVLLLRATARSLARVRAERVLLVGASPLACRLLEEIAARPWIGWKVLGVVDEGAEVPSFPHRRLGTLAQLGRIIHDERPDRIIVTLASRRGRMPLQPLLKSRLRGIPVEDGVETYERLTGKLAIEALTPSALIFSKDFPTSRPHVAFNRAASLAAAAAGLLAVAPLLVLIALAIVLDSRGPVFFVQDRVGLYGRRFRLIKFRTMRPSRSRASEWERDNLDRVTRIGTWLRRFRLDELPQLLNVLRGDMNLVGPRPHPVRNQDLFLRRIPYYALRSSVRPGITGWAQVRYGYANDLDEETEKMRYDLFYIKHISVWLDLRILLETVQVLFRRPSLSRTEPRIVPFEPRGVRAREGAGGQLEALPRRVPRAAPHGDESPSQRSA